MGKYSSGKYSRKKESKSKVILIMFIIVIFVITVIGIKVFFKNKKADRENIERAVDIAFSSLKKSDILEANKYMDYEQLVNSLDKMILQERKTNEVSNLEKKLFEDIEWTIETVKIKDDGTTTVIVEMKNKNFNDVIRRWMKEIVNEKNNGNGDISNIMALNKLENVLEQDDIKKKTVIKNVILEKENNDWKIVVNEDLRDLIFTGIESVITVLEGENK